MGAALPPRLPEGFDWRRVEASVPLFLPITTLPWETRGPLKPTCMPCGERFDTFRACAEHMQREHGFTPPAWGRAIAAELKRVAPRSEQERARAFVERALRELGPDALLVLSFEGALAEIPAHLRRDPPPPVEPTPQDRAEAAWRAIPTRWSPWPGWCRLCLGRGRWGRVWCRIHHDHGEVRI